MCCTPDADIKAFLGRASYRTVLATVGDKKARIEKRISQELDSDELQLKFWSVTKDGQRVGEDIKSAHPGAVKGSKVVALSVKKLLVAYEELNIANK